MTPIALVVVASSSLSACFGLILAVACAIACWSTHPDDASSSRSPAQFVQFVLTNLGVADLLFASSFLLAQGRDASPSGGPVCITAAIFNEYAGVASALWTAALAWTLRGAIVYRRSLEFYWGWRRSLLFAAVWGIPALVECALVLTLYLPQELIGPEQNLPWCHWRKDGLDFSLLLYSVLVASACFCGVCYCSVLRARGVGLREAALLEEEERLAAAGFGADDAFQRRRGSGDARGGGGASRAGEAARGPTAAVHEAAVRAELLRAQSRRLDFRLGSYVAAFLLSQAPALLHRLWQCGLGHPPASIAAAQALTQPAQGLLNALVYIHHGSCQAGCCKPCSERHHSCWCWGMAAFRGRDTSRTVVYTEQGARFA